MCYAVIVARLRTLMRVFLQLQENEKCFISVKQQILCEVHQLPVTVVAEVVCQGHRFLTTCHEGLVKSTY